MWIYNKKKVESLKCLPEGKHFAVYIIFFEDQTFYIGSKKLYTERNIKLSKKRAKELYTGKGAYKKKELKIKESDWKTYNSSSSVVLNKIKTGEKYTKKFISFHNTSQEMLMHEAYLILTQFIKNETLCLNEWVNLKFKINKK